MPNGEIKIQQEGKKETLQPSEKTSTEQIGSLSARVRLFEESINEFRKRIIFIEQNLVSNHKKAISDIKTLTSEITDIKKTILIIEDRILTVIKEIKFLAKKEDVEIIKKYVELLNPMKYVTAERVENIIKEILEEREQFKNVEKKKEANKESTKDKDISKNEEEIPKKRKTLNPEDVFNL